MLTSFKKNITQVSKTSKILINSAEQIYSSADTTEQAILKQKQDTESVAAAINELEASSAEVKNTSHFASDKSDNSNKMAEASMAIATQTETSINQLATEQQNLPAEEINQSVVAIRDNADTSLIDANDSKQTSE